MNAAPFFIVGSGRSGSTLLRVMLASHSRIAVPPETWYLVPLLEQLPADRALTPSQVEQAASIMTRHYRWPDMAMDESAFRRRLQELRDPLLRDVVEVVYQEHVRKEGKARWGDKTPPYITIVPQLSAMFPDALFIHLFRDGHDVAKSFQAQGWYGHHWYKCTQEWNESIDLDDRWNRTPLANRIFQLRYEDLVLHTERTVREVCRFLDEAYEPEMLAWEKHLERMIPAREASIHEKLKRKPQASDVYRWKQEMRPRDVLVVEAFMGERLDRLGYERRYRTRLWQPIFALVRGYCRLVLPMVDFQMRALRFLRKRIQRAQVARPGV